MHPIEQLRYVARASGADASLLVEEAASALGVFGRDPAGMVTACRRLLTRQPEIGALWWMAAQMVTSTDPWETSRDVIAALRSDPTGRHLAHELPDNPRVLISGWPDIAVAALPRRGDASVLVLDVEGQGTSVVRRLDRADLVSEHVDPAHVAGAVEESSLVILEAAAVGDGAALVDVGSVPAAAVARAVGVPVWLVVGVGRRLPEPYWEAIVERVADPDLPAFLAPHEVLSLGLVDRIVSPEGVGTELPRAECPVAQELLRPLV